MSRIYLPNGCYFTQPTVYPANWKSPKAPVSKPWYFNYRYYDPSKTNEFPHGKLISTRGMNMFPAAADRAQLTEQLMKQELFRLKVEGYNPITKTYTPFYDSQTDLYGEMPLLPALEIAKDKLKCSDATRKDVGSMLKFIEEALQGTDLSATEIQSVSRKTVIKVLERCALKKKKWSEHIYNKYRSYLMMLFKVVVKYEILQHNPVDEYVEKEKPVKKIRVTLSDDERKKVAAHLMANYPTFYRFLQIFFHSGARVQELLRIRVSEVNLRQQTFIATIRKGGQHIQVTKTIKNIALPYWKELLAEGKPDDFIFGQGLRPGVKAVRREQIIRRWKTHVKEDLGISADFYSLKHLNTTEVTDHLDEQAAAKLNSHIGTEMVAKVYDIRQQQRQHERLRKVNNEF